MRPWLGVIALVLAACGTESPEKGRANLDEPDDAGVVRPLDAGRVTPTPEPKPAAVVDASVATGLTYTANVRPILNRSCVPCHSDGNIAPFSLDTYESAKPFAKIIAAVSRARTMPPSVVDNSGECNTYRELPWLTDDEIARLEEWAEGGAPEGAAAPVPPVTALPKLSGEIGSIKTPPYVPSTELPDDWRCFVLDNPFDQAMFLTGFDTRPGDPRTAHHMALFYPLDDGAGLLAHVLDELEEGPGYTCFGSAITPATVIAAWAPGGGATIYPDNLGIEILPSRPLIVQMHYNTAATAMPGEDSTSVDLQVKREGTTPAKLQPVLDLEMALPPGTKDAKEVVERTFDKPVEVYGVFPHMHEIGKTLRVTVTDSKGERCLHDAPRYDFHWQRMYFFDKPITLEAGSKLSIDCRFDTTDRTQVTNWGESSQDEMCVAGLFIKL
ncbi:MAG: hypothetical protein ABW352_18710 [Polyangiales bacterium]